uniref:Integrin alpha FG-GAP repeat containing 1 n=1 Tax=Neogobius melanostomus TaxID=47308 RepID=A0A8C6T9F5_9GOBI
PSYALQDVTAELFGTENYGTIAAFGDLNSDKQTDIFVIRKQAEVVIFLADPKIPYFKPKVRINIKDLPVPSVVPGDYDGDSQMDVLLTTESKDGTTSAVIFWGQNQTLDLNDPLLLNNTFTDQPLIMDFNGDMIPDIFGVINPSHHSEVCYLTTRKLEWKRALNSTVKLRKPHSNAFIDLNKDFTAESIQHCCSFCLCHCVADGDGVQDHLLPVCLDEACQHSVIYFAKTGQDKPEWVPVLSNFQQRSAVWGFVPGELRPALHLGDYNLDGFPDALVVLRNTSGSGQQAFLLENVPCNNASCRSVGRMFHIHWDQSDLGAIQNAVMATFFDIYEDGILDMLVQSRSQDKDFIHALKNNFEADAYFVKVMGECPSCPAKPFGVNQPGPYVMYTTVDSNGNQKNASAGQLSQSAHFSLQLPYTVLGLGRSANFLDHLFVGIPRQPGEMGIRKQEWTAIIPNSQLIVIPYPHNRPRSWSAKLYLTPSNSVLLTAIALIGVCVFILVIIGILHWQEKKADDREKRQEAHRFHFDAM